MIILYYTMGESTKEDAYHSFVKLGHTVDLFEYNMCDYNLDSRFSKTFLKQLDNKKYDIVFSFYYIPLISKLSFLNKIRYVVWIFDAWPLTFYSKMIESPYNIIFSFDKMDCEMLRGAGARNVFHLPLAVNTERITQVLGKKERNETEEIVFVGNLYNGDANFFDQLEYLPDFTKGYVDALISSQLQMPGADLIIECMTEQLAESMVPYFSIEESEEYTWTKRDILLRMLLRNATSQERLKTLQYLSERFCIALYTQSDSGMLPKVKNCGTCDYLTGFPVVSANAKINLNFTPREIFSGISLRVLDIMGAGGFLMTNYQPEMLEYFEEGTDFVGFVNKKDLAEKAAYYLTHDAERKKIALNGKRKVEMQFTYEMQFGKMFDLIGRLEI